MLKLSMSHRRHSPNVQSTAQLKIRLADFKLSIMYQKFNPLG